MEPNTEWVFLSACSHALISACNDASHENSLNPISLDILRFRAKTMPRIKEKWQGLPNWHQLKGNRVKTDRVKNF